MRITLCFIVLMLLMPGCDGTDSQVLKEDEKKSVVPSVVNPKNNSPQERATTEVKKMHNNMDKKLGIVTEKGPTDWAPREKLCEAVLAKEDAIRFLGRNDLKGGMKKRAFGKPVKGHTECEWGAFTDKGFPEAILNVTIDCRSISLNVDRWRSTMKAIGKEEYRDISIGKGGGYLKIMVVEQTSYQINFVHDKVPCALNILQTFKEKDETEAVALHVHKKLTLENAVMP